MGNLCINQNGVNNSQFKDRYKLDNQNSQNLVSQTKKIVIKDSKSKDIPKDEKQNLFQLNKLLQSRIQQSSQICLHVDQNWIRQISNSSSHKYPNINKYYQKLNNKKLKYKNTSQIVIYKTNMEKQKYHLLFQEILPVYQQFYFQIEIYQIDLQKTNIVKFGVVDLQKAKKRTCSKNDKFQLSFEYNFNQLKTIQKKNPQNITKLNIKLKIDCIINTNLLQNDPMLRFSVIDLHDDSTIHKQQKMIPYRFRSQQNKTIPFVQTENNNIIFGFKSIFQRKYKKNKLSSIIQEQSSIIEK